jgi:hypothetical protein
MTQRSEGHDSLFPVTLAYASALRYRPTPIGALGGTMRIRRATIGASISGFLFLWSTLAGAREDEAVLRARVLKEFPEALKALQEHFSTAVGSVSYSREEGIARPHDAKRVGKFAFATRRPYWARVTKSPTIRAKSSGPGPEGKEVPEVASSSGPEIVYCYNKDYSFNLLKRKDSDSQYVIKSFDQNLDGEPSHEVKGQVYNLLYDYLDAPFSCPPLWRPSSSIIASDRSLIQHISEVRQDGENCLKLEVRLKEGIVWKTDQGRLSPEYNGWILVAPEKKWVVREYDLDAGSHRYRGRVEYGDIQDGFPVPRRFVLELKNQKTGRVNVHEYTFDDLRLVDPPDDAFTLAAFGLPELGQPGPTRSRYANRTLFWLLGAAAASLLVAIVLKYYAGALRRTPPESVPGAAERRPEGTPAN